MEEISKSSRFLQDKAFFIIAINIKYRSHSYSVVKMKYAFDKLINTLYMIEENQWAWKTVNRDFQNWNASRKKEKTEQNIQDLWDNYKGATYM